MSTHLHSICLTGRGPVINLKFQLYKVLQTDKYSLSQLREDKRNLSFHERHFPLAIFPQGLLASFPNHWYGDWPISSNANFPHLPNEGFPRRIRGSRVLRYTPYSFSSVASSGRRVFLSYDLIDEKSNIFTISEYFTFC